MWLCLCGIDPTWSSARIGIYERSTASDSIFAEAKRHAKASNVFGCVVALLFLNALRAFAYFDISLEDMSTANQSDLNVPDPSAISAVSSDSIQANSYTRAFNVSAISDKPNACFSALTAASSERHFDSRASRNLTVTRNWHSDINHQSVSSPITHSSSSFSTLFSHSTTLSPISSISSISSVLSPLNRCTSLNNFHIAHINVCSIPLHYALVNDLILYFDLDVLAISETWWEQGMIPKGCLICAILPGLQWPINWFSGWRSSTFYSCLSTFHYSGLRLSFSFNHLLI